MTKKTDKIFEHFCFTCKNSHIPPALHHHRQFSDGKQTSLTMMFKHTRPPSRIQCTGSHWIHHEMGGQICVAPLHTHLHERTKSNALKCVPSLAVKFVNNKFSFWLIRGSQCPHNAKLANHRNNRIKFSSWHGNHHCCCFVIKIFTCHTGCYCEAQIP